MPITDFGLELEKKEEKGITTFGLDDNVTTFGLDTEPAKPKPNFVEEKETKDTIGYRIFRTLNPMGLGHPATQKALFGDIPVVRKLLPKRAREYEPKGKLEKTAFIGQRLGRDIYLIAQSGGLAKLPKVVSVLSKVGRFGKAGAVMAKLAPELIRGATFGALTAGTEDPAEIAKTAAKTGAFFGAIPIAFRGLGKVSSKVMQTRLAQSLMKKIKPVITPLQTKARDLIFKRHSEMNVALYDSSRFIRGIEKNLSKVEREAIPFLREGTKVPKGLGRPDLEAIVNTQGKRLAPAVKEISNYLDDAHNFLLENYGKDVGFVERFIPRIWDIPKNKQKSVINWFVTRNPHLKHRSIRTIKEGVEKFNLTPKTLDVAELLRIYDQYKIKAVYNSKFVAGLMKLVDKEGNKLILRSDKAPADWITVDHPVLRRGRLIGKVGAKEIPIIAKVPLKVNPEIAQEVRTILEQPFRSEGIKALEMVNAFAKKLNLSISLFHHTALTETGVAAGMGKDIARIWNPRRIFRAVKNKDYDIFNRVPLSKDAIKHGVQFGAITDVQVGKIRGALNASVIKTQNIPVIGRSLKILRGFNEVWDRGLWDYFHNNLKLYGYEKLTQDMIKKNPKMPVFALKREVAQFVNDTFGGQSWDLLLKSPRWQQQMQWLLLAPDWTLSTLRQAMSPFGVGATGQISASVRKELGARFWERGVLYFWGGFNLLNKAFTEMAYGKGRYMWDNAEGHKTHLFIGHDINGSEQYMRWGKQFRELPEFFIDPFKKFGAKMSPAVRQVIEQFSEHAVGGFPLPFAKERFPKDVPQRAMNVIKMMYPFSFGSVARSERVVAFAMPVSRGLSNWKTRELFRQAILEKNMPRIRKLYISAIENNLDAEALFRQARTAVKSDITYDFKKEALTIVERLRKLGPVKGKEALLKMREAGRLTPRVEEQIVKILKQQAGIKEQRTELYQLLGR